MGREGVSENIIHNVVGCGSFQLILFLSVFGLTEISVILTVIFMTFGNYNPGWRCLDSNQTSSPNSSTPGVDHVVFIKDNCSLFQSCANVEFDPGTSTIVSEWGLLCDQAWIPSIIISLQMAGLAIGACASGYLGDAFGRSTVLHGAAAWLTVFNTISIFSTSWHMFGALRFFLGMGVGCFFTIYYVYVSEFVTIQWRSPIANSPVFPLFTVVFGVLCLTLKNWRALHIVAAVASALGVIPVIYLPESLRWLEVKNKVERFEATVRKMCKINGKKPPNLSDLNLNANENNRTLDMDRKYNIPDLFKGKSRKYTLILIIPWFSMSLIFYAITFGIKALSGNFYHNLLISYGIDIPFCVFALITPNYLGRKKSNLLFAGVSALVLLLAGCLQLWASGNVKVYGVMILVSVARIALNDFWGFMMLYTVELYPTVVRALGTGWGNTMARFGGIVAPFLIPNDESSVFVRMFIMSGVLLVVCFALMQLPETKGKALEETIEEKDSPKSHLEEEIL